MTTYYVRPISDKGISFVQGLLSDDHDLHELKAEDGIDYQVALIRKDQIKFLIRMRSDLKNGRDFALCASVRGEPLKWFKVRESQRLALSQLVRRADGKRL